MVSNVTDISDKVVMIEICSRQVTILLLETFSIRFHFCKLQFTFEPQEGLPAVSDLRQGFFCH